MVGGPCYLFVVITILLEGSFAWVLIGVGLANSGLVVVVVRIGCCPGGMIEIRLIGLDLSGLDPILCFGFEY